MSMQSKKIPKKGAKKKLIKNHFLLQRDKEKIEEKISGIKKKISVLRKNGKDLFIQEIKLRELVPKLRIIAENPSKKKFSEFKKSLDKLEKEITGQAKQKMHDQLKEYYEDRLKQ